MRTFDVKKLVELFKRSVMDFLSDNAMKFSAALSYYTIFALPPLLILIIAGGSFFFEEGDIASFFYSQLNDMVGPNTSMEVQKAIGNVEVSRSGVLPTILGVSMLLFSASGVFAEIQSSINYIWGIVAKPNQSIKNLLLNRVLSFAMIGSVGFVLLVSLMINSVVDVLYDYLQNFFAEETIYLVTLVNNCVLFLIITFLFALIFKTLPNGKIGFKETFVGAAFTAILFMIGKFGIGFYLNNTASSSLYGAAGSIIIMLIWVYYSAIILYFGAEFTKNYAELYGNPIKPTSYSTKIKKNVIAD